MQQALLPGQELDEGAIRHHRLDLGLVDGTDFRLRHNALDPVHSLFQTFLGGTEDADLAKIADFFEIDRRTRLALYFLDDLSLWSDNGADEFLVDKDLHHPRCMRLYFRACRVDRAVHGLEDMQPAFAGLLQRLAHNVHAETIHLDIHLYSADPFA